MIKGVYWGHTSIWWWCQLDITENIRAMNIP